MSKRVFWLKPSRPTAPMPELQPHMPMVNLSKGVQTCAVLDLNVLNRFRDHLEAPPGERSPHLPEEIEEIKKILGIPGLFVAAGFALGEADESYLDELVQSYESFFAIELPTYADAPNAIPAGRDRQRSRKFKALPTDDRQFMSVAYLALLKVHEILVCEPSVSPETKFDLYLEYMDRVADFVPGIETEVAKHCFFKTPTVSADPFLSRSHAIRKNFDKGGKGERRVDRVLNGARDIMYLRGAAIRDGKRLDGAIQDTWLLTCDAGLAALCASIHFVPFGEERAQFTAIAADPTRSASSFWRYADSAGNHILSERARGRRHGVDFGGDAHVERLSKLALELSDRLSQHN